MNDNNQFSKLRQKNIELPKNMQLSQKCWLLIINHFKDEQKAAEWFCTINPDLNYDTPNILLQGNQVEKLLFYIQAKFYSKKSS